MPPLLAGVRVLDLSRVLAGPWCAQMLGDFGAEVLKIERAGAGDDTRAWAPTFTSSEDGATYSSYFCAANRGKASLAIDIAQPEGAALVRRLAQASDVLIENYKVDNLRRYGLDFDALQALNPGLVYCSITGFGQTGPYRHRPGYDTIIQAMGGLMSVTGPKDGEPGAGPQRVGVPVIDLMTGVYAAFAIAAALHHRGADGQRRGQHIDLSLLDVSVSAMSFFAASYLATGRVAQRAGNANAIAHPSGSYACADGDVTLIVGNDAQFQRFCTLLGCAAAADDPRYATPALRVANAAALNQVIAPLIAQHPRAWCIGQFERIGIPCAVINDMQGLFDDPQVRARENVVELHHPAMGRVPVTANPVRLSATPATYGVPPPLLGEHTEAVLRRVLALGDDELQGLHARGVIA